MKGLVSFEHEECHKLCIFLGEIAECGMSSCDTAPSTKFLRQVESVVIDYIFFIKAISLLICVMLMNFEDMDF